MRARAVALNKLTSLTIYECELHAQSIRTVGIILHNSPLEILRIEGNKYEEYEWTISHAWLGALCELRNNHTLQKLHIRHIIDGIHWVSDKNAVLARGAFDMGRFRRKDLYPTVDTRLREFTTVLKSLPSLTDLQLEFLDAFPSGFEEGCLVDLLGSKTIHALNLEFGNLDVLECTENTWKQFGENNTLKQLYIDRPLKTTLSDPRASSVAARNRQADIMLTLSGPVPHMVGSVLKHADVLSITMNAMDVSFPLDSFIGNTMRKLVLHVQRAELQGLGKWLGTNTTLKTLNIRTVYVEGVKLFTNALERNTALETLTFSRCTEGEDLSTVANALKRNTTLNTFFIRYSRIQANILINGIGANRGIQAFELEHTKPRRSTTTSRLNLNPLANNNTLRELVVHYPGGADLGFLKQNTTLQYLAVETDDYITGLGSLLQNSKLGGLSLNINNNKTKIIEKANKSLMRQLGIVLRVNTTLQNLSLGSVQYHRALYLLEQLCATELPRRFDGVDISKTRSSRGSNASIRLTVTNIPRKRAIRESRRERLESALDNKCMSPSHLYGRSKTIRKYIASEKKHMKTLKPLKRW